MDLKAEENMDIVVDLGGGRRLATHDGSSEMRRGDLDGLAIELQGEIEYLLLAKCHRRCRVFRPGNQMGIRSGPL
jgi:hypothetical protein